jgi:hypothetical protein
VSRCGREAFERGLGRALCAAVCAVLGCGELVAQEATGGAPAPPEWEFDAPVYAFFVPDDDDYVQPEFIANRGWLHLEARYNYEDQDTVSTWMGYNFSFGKTVLWSITPMLGGVFGDTSGVAPGYEAAFDWRWLSLYTEGEHVFSTDGEEGSFFYSWSTMTASPVAWLQLGLVVQHTKAYETDRDIQRGILVGVSGEHLELAAHMFNPDDEEPTYVLAATLAW